MASGFGSVEVNVNHVLHRTGAIEAPAADDQVPERERIGLFLDLVRRAGKETGFTVTSVELIESFLFRGGHLPELHMVIAQLPSGMAVPDSFTDVHQSETPHDGRWVAGTRSRDEWRDHEKQQGIHPEERSPDYYQKPRNGL